MNKNLETNINKLFPNLTWNRTKFIASGWDYNILLLDDNFLVRIPKNSDAKKRMPVDFCLLEYLQEKIDANIPIPILKDIKSKIAVYKAVKGIQMNEARYKKLSLSQKNKFSKKISVFLSQLHKIPKDIARECGITQKSVATENKKIISNAKLIYSHLNKQEKNILDDFMKKRKKY